MKTIAAIAFLGTTLAIRLSAPESDTPELDAVRDMTAKDFSEGEISSIIMGDSNKIWDFIWQMPEYLECPFILISACYFTFQSIGWYGFIVVILTLLQFTISYYRES